MRKWVFSCLLVFVFFANTESAQSGQKKKKRKVNNPALVFEAEELGVLGLPLDIERKVGTFLDSVGKYSLLITSKKSAGFADFINRRDQLVAKFRRQLNSSILNDVSGALTRFNAFRTGGPYFPDRKILFNPGEVECLIDMYFSPYPLTLMMTSDYRAEFVNLLSCTVPSPENVEKIRAEFVGILGRLRSIIAARKAAIASDRASARIATTTGAGTEEANTVTVAAPVRSPQIVPIPGKVAYLSKYYIHEVLNLLLGWEWVPETEQEQLVFLTALSLEPGNLERDWAIQRYSDFTPLSLQVVRELIDLAVTRPSDSMISPLSRALKKYPELLETFSKLANSEDGKVSAVFMGALRKVNTTAAVDTAITKLFEQFGTAASTRDSIDIVDRLEKYAKSSGPVQSLLLDTFANERLSVNLRFAAIHSLLHVEQWQVVTPLASVFDRAIGQLLEDEWDAEEDAGFAQKILCDAIIHLSKIDPASPRIAQVLRRTLASGNYNRLILLIRELTFVPDSRDDLVREVSQFHTLVKRQSTTSLRAFALMLRLNYTLPARPPVEMQMLLLKNVAVYYLKTETSKDLQTDIETLMGGIDFSLASIQEEIARSEYLLNLSEKATNLRRLILRDLALVRLSNTQLRTQLDAIRANSSESQEMKDLAEAASGMNP